jgi:prepilin-type N-terminal cleavage/methylation domain-containing protein
MKKGTRMRGFSMIELMTAIAIVAILGAVAVVGYQEYTTRAAAADLVSAHHNIRSAVLAQGDKSADNCDDLLRGYDRKLLDDPHAALDYGFEAVPGGGFRPVLTVCATAGGPGKVAVVKRAYESFSAMGVAEKSSTTGDTLASFSVRLTDGDKALCKNWKARSAGCGQAAPAVTPRPPAQPVQPPTQPASPAIQPAQQAAATTAAPLPPVPQPRSNQVPPAVTTAATCPAGQEKVLITSGAQAQNACAPKCQTGERRNTAGLCIKDEPPPPPAWAANAPDPGTPPPPAQPGQLPTCAAGSKLATTFVRGVLTNTCVTEACPAGQKPDGSGQCVSSCPASLTWDRANQICIDKSSPPPCPDGRVRDSDGQCGCPNRLADDGDGNCVCADTYGPTCDLDFGLGMCGEDFVQEMCTRFCSVCTDPPGLPPLGTGGAPQIPPHHPVLKNLLPHTRGETLVLDDRQLMQAFGVVSPDGSPVSITRIELTEEGHMLHPGDFDRLKSMYSFTRRDDGRWQITVTGDPMAPILYPGGRNGTYRLVDLVTGLRFTFTNGVGSTQTRTTYATSRW